MKNNAGEIDAPQLHHLFSYETRPPARKGGLWFGSLTATHPRIEIVPLGGGRCSTPPRSAGLRLLGAPANVAVDVKRGSYLGMTQTLLHNLGMNPLAEHHCCVGMASIVEAVAFENSTAITSTS